MVAPLLMYGAPAAAAIGTGVWLYLKKKKANAPTSQPKTAADDPTQAAVDAGRQYGCDRGTADGAAGATALLDIGSDLDASAKASASGQPAQFLAGAAAGYSDCYAAALPPAVKTDSTVDPGTGVKKSDAVKTSVDTAGKNAARAAFLDGCTRGVGFGWKDAANDYANNPTPSSSRFGSDKVANAAYQYAYSHSYNVGWSTRHPMTGLPGYDVGENTEIPSDQAASAISSCNSSSNFETWYTSHSGVAGFSVSGVASDAVGAVVSGASGLVSGVQAAVNGLLDTSVAGYKVRDAAHVAGGGLSGFMVAGVPGAVIGTCTTGAMQSERVRKMGHVLPTVVAGVTGFVVAGIPGAVAGTLAVVGAHMRHATNKPRAFTSTQIERATSDVKSGKLTAARATELSRALAARGDKQAASAVQAAIEGLGVGASHAVAMPLQRRHPMMRRRTAG